MPRRRLDVSEDADRDLDDVFEYTELTWGHEQAVSFLQSIADALDWLLSFPNAGRDREGIAIGLRSLSLDHHVVLYRVYEDRVRIHRVIHHREDNRSALQNSGDFNAGGSLEETDDNEAEE